MINKIKEVSQKIKFEYKITALYLIVGLLWIYFSDTFFNFIISDKNILAKINIVKGSFYVTFTSLLLFFFIKKHMNKLRKAQRKAKIYTTKVEKQNEKYRKINHELQETKEKIHKSEERFRLTLEATQIGLWDWNVAEDTWYASPVYYTMLGYKPDDANGDRKIWITRVHPDDVQNVTEKIQNVVSLNFNTYEYEARIKHANGEYRWQKVIGFGVERDENGKPIRMIGIRVDIDDRKKAEISLKEKNDEYLALNEELLSKNDEYYSLNEEYIATNRTLCQTNEEFLIAKEKAEESNRLKTAFLQNISHEIRTPMNAIIGFSDLLGNVDISIDKRNKFIDIIQKSTQQLLSIVTDILTISTLETKQEKLNIKPVNINTIINDVFELFKPQADSHNIELRKQQKLPNTQAEIYTDDTKIIQILTNILNNALKFTHSGQIEFGYDKVTTQPNDTFIRFFVRDTGIGIKPDLHNKIFERFIQADKAVHLEYGGTGLGLSICKGFVELFGGQIWVESEIGKGSIFYFTIPYKPIENTKNDLETQQNNDVVFEKKTILVAEDVDFNFMYIEELLKQKNIMLIHAEDGKKTVDICNENNKIDLILMDIKMPLMDGYTAAKIIKQQHPSIPIIAQTAYALDHERGLYNDSTFNDYITKPISKTELYKILNKYISV